MKTTKSLLFFLAMCMSFPLLAQNAYQIGDEIDDMYALNFEGETILLQKEYKDAKGAILAITCNTCPWANRNEERIKALHAKYAPQGFPVIAVNPNDVSRKPGDSMDAMKARAKDKGYEFAYLRDETQAISKAFGATKTPDMAVLENVNGTWFIRYFGAIDDSPQSAANAKVKYLENAVDAVMAGETVKNPRTKTIGCSIKWKES